MARTLRVEPDTKWNDLNVAAVHRRARGTDFPMWEFGASADERRLKMRLSAWNVSEFEELATELAVALVAFYFFFAITVTTPAIL
jgi:hypothetical protein